MVQRELVLHVCRNCTEDGILLAEAMNGFGKTAAEENGYGVVYACLTRADEAGSYLMLSRLPALRKVFQAAGRHGKSPGKRGLVFLPNCKFDSETVKGLILLWMRRDLTCDDFDPKRLRGLTQELWDSGGRRRPPF